MQLSNSRCKNYFQRDITSSKLLDLFITNIDQPKIYGFFSGGILCLCVTLSTPKLSPYLFPYHTEQFIKLFLSNMLRHHINHIQYVDSLSRNLDFL